MTPKERAALTSSDEKERLAYTKTLSFQLYVVGVEMREVLPYLRDRVEGLRLRQLRTWLDLKTLLLELGIHDSDLVGGIIVTEGDSFHVVIDGRKHMTADGAE